MDENETGNRPGPFPFLKKGQGTARFGRLSKSQSSSSLGYHGLPSTRRTSTPKQNAVRGFPDTSSRSLPSPILQQTPVNIRPRTAETGDSGLAGSAEVINRSSGGTPPNQYEIHSNQLEEDFRHCQIEKNLDDSTMQQSEFFNERGQACVERLADMVPGIYKNLKNDLNGSNYVEIESNRSQTSDYSAGVNSNMAYKPNMYEQGSNQTKSTSSGVNIEDHCPNTSWLASHSAARVKPKNVIYQNYMKNQNEFKDPTVERFKKQLGPEIVPNKSEFRMPSHQRLSPIVPPTQPRQELSFLQTPILPHSTNDESWEIPEEIAVQLRGMILYLEGGVNAWEEKQKELELAMKYKMDYLEMKRKQEEANQEREVKNWKDKCVRIAAEKKKQDDEIAMLKKDLEKAQEEVNRWKNDLSKSQANCANLRTQNKKLTDKAEKFENDLEMEKKKSERYERQYMVTSDRLTLLRQQLPEMNRPMQNQPLQPKNNQRKPMVPRFQKSSTTPMDVPLSVFPRRISTPIQTETLRHTSTAKSNKVVRWNEKIAETYDPNIFDDEVFEANENLEGVLERKLPGDKELIDASDSNECFKKIYVVSNVALTWIKNKKCGCETVSHENRDWWFLSTNEVQVLVKYFADQKQIEIEFGGFRLLSFASRQLELHRPNNDLTCIAANGIRYERFHTQNGYYTEQYDYESRKRIFQNGTTEDLDLNEEKTALRNDRSFVTTVSDDQCKEHRIYHPEFRLTRSDREDLSGLASLKVYYPGTNQQQYLQVNMCPDDGVAKIKHCTENEGRKDSKFCAENAICAHLRK